MPVVCSTRYQIERFYTVNAALLVAGIAIVATVMAAPAHALYRNSYGYEEGRNVYHQAADKLTRLWHEQMGTPLSIVGGNDSLGVAVAFYSSDHPHYGEPFAFQYSLALPREVTPERGWAALCFDDQDDCLEWTGRMAAHAGNYVKREFSVQSSLFGIPGIKRNLVAFLVAPRREPDDAPSSLVNDAGQGGGHVPPQTDPPLRVEPDVALPENQPPGNAPQTNDPGANMLVHHGAAKLFVLMR